MPGVPRWREIVETHGYERRVAPYLWQKEIGKDVTQNDTFCRVKHDYGVWPFYFRREYIPQIEFYASCLKDRLPPTVTNLEEEAKKVEEDTYWRLLSKATSVDPDIASLAEQAVDEGLSHYQMMEQTVQGITNLFTVGLFHLFEQQLMYFHRKWLMGSDDRDQLKIDVAKDQLLQRGIDVKGFTSYSKVHELRVLANCIKHGDGPSCEELRRVQPILFRSPHLRDHPEMNLPWNPPPRPVIQPMAGEDIYMTMDEFVRYAEAVKTFWSELGSALEG
jgi:hypothetical protein